MLVLLTGVLQDGSPLKPGVPADPRKTVRVPRGATVTLRVALVKPTGEPVPVAAANGTLTLVVKDTPWNASGIFPPKTATPQPTLGKNIADFVINPTDVRNPQPGRYLYDVTFVSVGGVRDVVIPASPFILEPAVMSV